MWALCSLVLLQDSRLKRIVCVSAGVCVANLIVLRYYLLTHFCSPSNFVKIKFCNRDEGNICHLISILFGFSDIAEKILRDSQVGGRF